MMDIGADLQQAFDEGYEQAEKVYQQAFEDIRAEIRQKQWHIGVDSANQVIEIINKYTGGQNDQS